MTDRLHPVQKRLNGSKKLFVKWPVYQQELHSVRYKFPLTLDELFQTWSPPSLSPPLFPSLLPSLSFSETRVQQEKWIRLRQDMWQTRNIERLWWLITLAAGNETRSFCRSNQRNHIVGDDISFHQCARGGILMILRTCCVLYDFTFLF